MLLAAFLLLSRGLTLPAALLSAALCHELAHVLTLHALHAPPRRLTLSASGAELYVPDLHRLSYGGELLAVAAGPRLQPPGSGRCCPPWAVRRWRPSPGRI